MKKLLSVILTFLSSIALGAETVSVLAVPASEGGKYFQFLDTSVLPFKSFYSPSLEKFQGSVKEGYCYNYVKNVIIGQDETLSCYNYYMYHDNQTSSSTFDITGYVIPVGDIYGEGIFQYAITGVTGVEYCGEREDCDKIVIFSFASKTALKDTLKAFSYGCKVRAFGAQAWNYESIDIVVQKIECNDGAAD